MNLTQLFANRNAERSTHAGLGVIAAYALQGVIAAYVPPEFQATTTNIMLGLGAALVAAPTGGGSGSP